MWAQLRCRNQNAEDEKENASSPTKVKKLSKKNSPDDENNNNNSKKKQQQQQPQSPKKSKSATLPATNGGSSSVNRNNSHQTETLADTIKRNQQLTVDTNNETNRASSQQPSPLSSKSAGTTINIQPGQPRCPVLSASDAANSASFVRGVCIPSTTITNFV